MTSKIAEYVRDPGTPLFTRNGNIISAGNIDVWRDVGFPQDSIALVLINIFKIPKYRTTYPARYTLLL
jgi:hypothetical protein